MLLSMKHIYVPPPAHPTSTPADGSNPLSGGDPALSCTQPVHPLPYPPTVHRIHRLGQYKPITVVRFVIAGTIEERILKLQVGSRLPDGPCVGACW